MIAVIGDDMATQTGIGVALALVSAGLLSCSDDTHNRQIGSEVWSSPTQPMGAGASLTQDQNETGRPENEHGETQPTPGNNLFDDADSTQPMEADGPAVHEVNYRASSPPILRLTQNQIRHSLTDVFGESIAIPSTADPDLTEGGFKVVGAGLSTPSTRGVESIEKMAFAVASEVVSEDNRSQTIGCDLNDIACVRTFIERRGRQLWRRSLTPEEFARLFEVFSNVKDRLENPYTALEFVIAALIQSPHFIFRREIASNGRFTDFAMASRLSYLLWDTTPDDILLDAAESGELSSERGLQTQIERLLASPRSEAAILRFFEQWFELEKLEQLNKDPMVFTAMTSDLGKMARRETLLNIAEVIFVEDSDLRGLLTRERTFVNRKLAALYGIRAPVREGFGVVELTRQNQRRGLLGQLSFLALHSHPVSTSATLRGLFVRSKLLCQTVPPPPADVDTSIPEPSGERQTLRERVDEHLTNEACSSCHLLTDPIGLAFENFDGLGVYRTTDNGGIIDPSGELDGRPFEDAWAITDMLRNHPGFPQCIVRNLHRFVTGRIETSDQKPMLEAMTRQFAKDTYRFKPLLKTMLMSRVFRQAGSVSGGQL